MKLPNKLPKRHSILIKGNQVQIFTDKDVYQANFEYLEIRFDKRKGSKLVIIQTNEETQ